MLNLKRWILFDEIEFQLRHKPQKCVQWRNTQEHRLGTHSSNVIQHSSLVLFWLFKHLFWSFCNAFACKQREGCHCIRAFLKGSSPREMIPKLRPRLLKKYVFSVDCFNHHCRNEGESSHWRKYSSQAEVYRVSTFYWQMLWKNCDQQHSPFLEMLRFAECLSWIRAKHRSQSIHRFSEKIAPRQWSSRSVCRSFCWGG